MEAISRLGSVLVLGVAVSLGQAETLHVPGDFLTIQAAINAAADGDVVLVGPGRYDESLDLLGKEIALSSSHGAEQTVVYGYGDYLLRCISGETPQTIVQGIAFRESVGVSAVVIHDSATRFIDCVFDDNYVLDDDGGAVKIENGVVCFEGCSFRGNSVQHWNQDQLAGGAIYARNGSLTLIDCTFFDNHVSDVYGGDGAAVYARDMDTFTMARCSVHGHGSVAQDPINMVVFVSGEVGAIDACKFAGNEGLALQCSFDELEMSDTSFAENVSPSNGGGGGGATIHADSLLVQGCDFVANQSTRGGAGMRCDVDSFGFIEDCTFADNHSETVGGGLQLAMWWGHVRACEFIGNSSEYGGGLLIDQGDHAGGLPLRLIDSLFVGNAARVLGGALASDDRNFRLDACTIVDNTALLGGAVFTDQASLYCEGLVLRGNGTDPLAGIASYHRIEYSNVEGGWDGEGNIDADPLFADPAAGDFRLSPDSPCIDAGDSSYNPTHPFDLDGLPRIVDGDNDGLSTVDMGAYEYQPNGSPCIADLDGDGDTDQSDLGILLIAYGLTDGGDINGDGDTDQADLGLLLNDYECGV
jgi:Right handed beta helix region